MTKRAWLALCVAMGVSVLSASCGSDEATDNDTPPSGTGGSASAQGGNDSGGLIGGDDGTGGTDATTGGRATSGGSGSGGETASGGSNAGSPGTGGTPSTPGATLGQDCVSDESCGDLQCLFAEESGVPNGLCTTGCLEDADCPSGGVCLAFTADDGTPAGLCLEGCTPGDPAVGEVKCHNRNEMTCSLLYLTTGATCSDDADCEGDGELCDVDGNCRRPSNACYPMCGSDLDCPDEMFCDPGSGACVDEEPTGDPVGETCDPEAEEDTCLGRCVTVVDENDEALASQCTADCKFLAEGQCGWTDMTEPAPAVCFPRGDTTGEGDQGFCVTLCDCDADCAGDQKCFEYDPEDPTFSELFGHPGVCFYDNGDESLETCPE